MGIFGMERWKMSNVHTVYGRCEHNAIEYDNIITLSTYIAQYQYVKQSMIMRGNACCRILCMCVYVGKCVYMYLCLYVCMHVRVYICVCESGQTKRKSCDRFFYGGPVGTC